MVYGFVKQSRGHVKIYSEVGHGDLDQTLFAARARDGAGRRGGGWARRCGSGGSETLLVVEDSATVRGIAVSMLRGLGYSVLEAADGHAALAILETRVPIDLLFTDLIMPNGINGQDLLRRARALRPDLRAMFTVRLFRAVPQGPQLRRRRRAAASTSPIARTLSPKRCAPCSTAPRPAG
jgi:CheY-like chemotaxis protein